MPSGSTNAAKLARVRPQPSHSQRIGVGERAASVVQVLGATMRVAYHRLISTLMVATGRPRACRNRLQYGVNAPSAA